MSTLDTVLVVIHVKLIFHQILTKFWSRVTLTCYWFSYQLGVIRWYQMWAHRRSEVEYQTWVTIHWWFSCLEVWKQCKAIRQRFLHIYENKGSSLPGSNGISPPIHHSICPTIILRFVCLCVCIHFIRPLSPSAELDQTQTTFHSSLHPQFGITPHSCGWCTNLFH